MLRRLIDGAGLAAGVLNHLLELENERPKVIAATHFHGQPIKKNWSPAKLTSSEIFESNCLQARPEMAFRHMEVQIDSLASETDDQIIYLYK